MKKSHALFPFLSAALVLLCVGAGFADEIHFNDGNVLKGKIIQVTDKAIEYDPEGDEPFAMVPRGQISKIVYDSGNLVYLNEGGGIPGAIEVKRREPATRAAKGVHQHDGFFFRGQLGFGRGKSVIRDFLGDDLTLEGPSTTINLQFGYAIFDNFILYLDNGATVMPEAEASWGMLAPGINGDTDVTVSTFGVGASYYFMPVNIYISPSILLADVSYDGNIVKGDSNGGWGVSFTVGKEWWVSDNWGLGVALFAYYGKDTVTEKTVDQDYDVVNTVFGIMFSATYN